MNDTEGKERLGNINVHVQVRNKTVCQGVTGEDGYFTCDVVLDEAREGQAYSVRLIDYGLDYQNATYSLSLEEQNKMYAMTYMAYPGVQVTIQGCTGLLASEEKTFTVTQSSSSSEPIKSVTTRDCSVTLDDRKLFQNDTTYYLQLQSPDFITSGYAFTPEVPNAQLDVSVTQIIREQYAYPTYYNAIAVLYSGDVSASEHFNCSNYNLSIPSGETSKFIAPAKCKRYGEFAVIQFQDDDLKNTFEGVNYLQYEESEYEDVPPFNVTLEYPAQTEEERKF